MKTKHIQYQTHGTCSQLIDVTADENDIIQQVFFLGGCNVARKSTMSSPASTASAAAAKAPPAPTSCAAPSNS